MRRALALSLLLLACHDNNASAPDTTAPVTAEPAAADASASPWTGMVDEATFKAMHELRDDAPPTLYGKDIDLAGTKAYLALPEGATAPMPAVLVIHEWWGLNDHVRHYADRLAADGYAALAIDLYAGKVATTPDEAMAAMKSVDDAAARKVLHDGHRFLHDDPRIGATHRGVIGWCFGGGWSLQHAITEPDLDAAVIYYGHLVDDPTSLAKIHAKLLGVFGDRDTSIPTEAVSEFAAAVKRAGKSLELHTYDAVHAFANPSNPHYDQVAAADAWAHVRTFLRANLR